MDPNCISDNTICLFDMDGTLTKPRQKITPEMTAFIEKLKLKIKVGLVGGSNLEKIEEQMGGKDVIYNFSYVFAENGLVAYRNGDLIAKESILSYIGEEKLQQFINYCLHYMSKITLPAKRGNFIEFRTGLINICPVGRSCSQIEREQFAAYDKEHKIRENFVNALKNEFPNLGLVYAIGGQISFDAFPIGWDKSFCLKYLAEDNFKDIHFFGDKTYAGGNDHEIFIDPRTTGHTVISPEDTIDKLTKLFF